MVKKIFITAFFILIISTIARAAKKRNKMEDFTEDNFAAALRDAKNKFGYEIAANIERIYRLETSHFKSGGFTKTGAAGMEAATGKEIYPYGWTSMVKSGAWPKHKPTGIIYLTEGGTGKLKPFLKFDKISDAVMTLGYFLKYFNNNAGRWFASDSYPAKQTEYANYIKNIRVNYV